MKRIVCDRVLCAVDLSPCAEAVLRRALVVADAHGAAVDVLHVLDAGPGAVSVLEPRRDQRLRYVQQMLPQWDSIHVKTRVRVAHGDPATEILRSARQQSAALVVIGGGRRWSSRAVGLGRTARRLLQQSAAPLLVVPDCVSASAHERIRPEHIVCAVSAEPSIPTIGHALSLTQEFGTRLTLLHVGRETFEEAGEMTAPALLELRRVVPDVAHHWCDIEECAVVGDVAERIVHATRRLEPDLLVIGTARDGFATSDSAVASIVRQATCDVLVVPQPATALFATAAGAQGRVPMEVAA